MRIADNAEILLNVFVECAMPPEKLSWGLLPPSKLPLSWMSQCMSWFCSVCSGLLLYMCLLMSSCSWPCVCSSSFILFHHFFYFPQNRGGWLNSLANLLSLYYTMLLKAWGLGPFPDVRQFSINRFLCYQILLMPGVKHISVFLFVLLPSPTCPQGWTNLLFS
jgi:hypothetical protein